ncbi:MAG: hypothetical protein LBK42_02005 [Propionibacteriaceae bacterium]|jgi:hypothetical protein|nr:hypothetical protein [Propionibacteriaceae bacterium]
MTIGQLAAIRALVSLSTAPGVPRLIEAIDAAMDNLYQLSERKETSEPCRNPDHYELKA